MGREERFKLMDGFIICFVFFGGEEGGETTDAHSWSLSNSAHAFPIKSLLVKISFVSVHRLPGWADVFFCVHVKQAGTQNLTCDAGVRRGSPKKSLCKGFFFFFCPPLLQCESEFFAGGTKRWETKSGRPSRPTRN